MELSTLVKELDFMIINGKMVEAFDRFFHENCVTHYSANDKSVGKKEKKNRLEHFAENVLETNAIVLHNVAIGENVTMSEMSFAYTFLDGTHLRWNEILRRIWLDGKVIDERYYIGEDTDVSTPDVKTVKPKKKVIKK